MIMARLQLSFQIWKTLPQSVDEVEAMAAVRASFFAKNIDAFSIIFEGDSEVIFKFLICEDTSFASYSHLIIFLLMRLNSYQILLLMFFLINFARHARYFSNFRYEWKYSTTHQCCNISRFGYCILIKPAVSFKQKCTRKKKTNNKQRFWKPPYTCHILLLFFYFLFL